MLLSKIFQQTLKIATLSMIVSSVFASTSASAIYEMRLPNQQVQTPKSVQSNNSGVTFLRMVRADGSNSSPSESNSSTISGPQFSTGNSSSYSNSTSTSQVTYTGFVFTNGNGSTSNYFTPSNNTTTPANTNPSNGNNSNGIVTYNNLQPNYQTFNFGTPINGSCPDSFSQEMLRQINDFRRQNGVNPLRLDGTLSNVACGHSWWMNNNQKLDHYGVDGTNPFQRCERAGTSCNAENVAYHSAKDINWMMEFFRNSPAHRANMLNSDYTKVGIGMGNIYATQLFAE
jgi:uncharacterized protein YkwD